MRYFKIEPYPNKYFVCPDGFSYCKVSREGKNQPYDFNQGTFIDIRNGDWEATIIDNRDSLSGSFEILDRRYFKDRLYDYKYVKVIEELTVKQFNNVINTYTYMKELVD